MKRNGPYLLALLLQLVGAGGALLVSVRHWQTISTSLDGRVDVLQVTGRSVNSASTAFALVGLAGVVAVLATRGRVRRAVGAVVALAGVGLVWQAFAAAGAVSAGRARSLVSGAHPTVAAEDTVPHIATHALWPVLSGVCGVVVLAAGALIAWRGAQWQAMSARYDNTGAAGAPEPDIDPEQVRQRAATALWSALDRGEDPTR